MCTPLAPDNLLGEKNQTLSQEGLEVILKVMENVRVRRSRVTPSGCETTAWESETSERCLVIHGSRDTRRGVMTVDTGMVGSFNRSGRDGDPQ